MTELLLIGAAMLLIGSGLWVTIRMAKKNGEINARLEQARADAEAQRKASEILVEHRTVDDTAGKLSDGKF